MGNIGVYEILEMHLLLEMVLYPKVVPALLVIKGYCDICAPNDHIYTHLTTGGTIGKSHSSFLYINTQYAHRGKVMFTLF